MPDAKKIPLAELLLRRKELNALFQMRFDAKRLEIYRDQVTRRKVNDETDQVEGHVSLIDKEKLEKEANYYAHQRRLADSIVQQANWTTEVSVSAFAMSDEDLEGDGVTTVKLAELLTRRKELEERIRIAPSPTYSGRGSVTEDLYKSISERLPISDGLGDLISKVSKVSPSETAVFKNVDNLQRKLCEVDRTIQKANWSTEVTITGNVLDNFTM